MDNRDIVTVLDSAIALMELHDTDPRKVKSYGNAIFNLERLERRLSEMEEEEVLKINGVGPSIANSINEIVSTGTLSLLEDLTNQTPPGILDLLSIRGIGAGKIKTAWKELNVESLDDMLGAIDSGELGKLKGFGEKTVQNLQASILFHIENRNKMLLPEAIDVSELIIKEVSENITNCRIEEVGELRLKRPVINKLSFLFTGENGAKENLRKAELPFEKNAAESGPFAIRGKLGEVPVEILICDQSEYESRLFLETGSEKHLAIMAERGVPSEQVGTEADLYNGNAIVNPVRREGLSELTISQDELITEPDLKGILHCHSTYSDGRNTLREMAEACRDKGYQYLGIADHSKSAFYYANGMYENRVQEQHKEIDQLNEELAPFRIFKGIESDILPEGDLDYELDFIKEFDFVVASVHSVLNMDIEKATSRIMRAIENPYTTILGHLTGRVLLQRKGYPVDHKQIIDHCAEHNVAIEINSHPSRLDLDWTWVPYAMEKEITLSINPDAHSIKGYNDMKYGVWMGQKGGLLKSRTLNALSVNEISDFFDARKLNKGGS